MSIAVAFKTLTALSELRDACTAPEAALAKADATIAKVRGQLAIADFVAYGAAMKRDDLTACIDIERRWGLFCYPPDVVSVGLKAAAEGRDISVAIAALQQSEIAS